MKLHLCSCLFIACSLGVSTQDAVAQRLSNPVSHVECSRGINAVNAAAYSKGGRLCVVGANGRYGVLESGAETFRWVCLPNTVELSAAFFADSQLIVGGSGGRIWIDRGVPYELPSLPQAQTVRCMGLRGKRLIVGTDEGDIWSSAIGDVSGWIKEFSSGDSILAIDATPTRAVAVGVRGMLLNWDAVKGEWHRAAMQQTTELFSSVRIADTVIFIGTSDPAVITYWPQNGDERKTSIVNKQANFREDHLGWPERIVSIDVRGDSVLVGGYLAPERRTLIQGVYLSTNAGASFRRLSFYNVSFGKTVSRDVRCVGIKDDTITAIVGSYRNPIVVYRQTPDSSNFTISTQTNVFEMAQTTMPFPKWRSSFITSALPGRDGQHLIAAIAPSFVEGELNVETAVTVIYPNKSETTIDTIAHLPGRVFFVNREKDLIVAVGTSKRILVSRNEGQSWKSGSPLGPNPTPDDGLVSIYDPIMFDSLFVVSDGFTLTVVDTALSFWSQVDLPVDAPGRPYPRSVVQSGRDRFFVHVPRYLNDSLLSETVLEYQLVGRQVAAIRQITLPESYQRPESIVYKDGDSLCVLLTRELKSDDPYPRLRYETCTWNGKSWNCSEFVANVDGREMTEFAHYILGVRVSEDIGLTAGSRRYVGIGQPKNWSEIPPSDDKGRYSEFLTSGGVRMGNKYYTFGDYHCLTSFDIDSIVSSIDSRSNQSTEFETTDFGYRKIRAVYLLDGRSADVGSVEELPTGTYLQCFDNGETELILVVNGSVVARQRNANNHN